MKRLPVWSAFVLTVWLTPSHAMVHHSFEAVYDGERLVSVDGIVEEFRFMNPHATMTLSSQDAEGNPVTWTVEFDGSINLTVYDWTPGTIRPGERVTVYGNPSHRATSRMFFRRLVRTDGTELVRPTDAAGSQIDELRRQRR